MSSLRAPTTERSMACAENLEELGQPDLMDLIEQEEVLEGHTCQGGTLKTD